MCGPLSVNGDNGVIQTRCTTVMAFAEPTSFLHLVMSQSYKRLPHFTCHGLVLEQALERAKRSFRGVMTVITF